MLCPADLVVSAFWITEPGILRRANTGSVFELPVGDGRR
jgi:hypothetical protein